MLRPFFNVLFLPALNLLVFFLVAQLYLEPALTGYYWAALSCFVLLSFYAGLRNFHSTNYYAIFIIYVPFFGYLVQSAIGVQYFLVRGSVGAFGFEAFTAFALNALGVMIGGEIFHARQARKAAGRSPTIPRGIPSVLAVPSLLLLSLAAAAMAISVFGFDGFLGTRFDQFLEARNATGAVTTSSYSAFLFQVLKYLPYIVAIACLGGYASTGRNAPFFWLLFVLASIYALGVSNPVNTARFVSMTAISLLIVAWIAIRNRAGWLTPVLSMAPAVLVVALPATSVIRRGLNAFSLERLFANFSTLEFSTMQMAISATNLTTRYDGFYTLSGLLIFVPRRLFPEKAESLGVEVAIQSGFVYHNSALPSFFAPYMDGGFIALAAFSIVSGYVLAWGRIADGMDWFRRRDFYRLAVFALVPIFARGDFSTFMISGYALAAAYEATRFAARLRWGSARVQVR